MKQQGRMIFFSDAAVGNIQKIKQCMHQKLHLPQLISISRSSRSRFRLGHSKSTYSYLIDKRRCACRVPCNEAFTVKVKLFYSRVQQPCSGSQ